MICMFICKWLAIPCKAKFLKAHIFKNKTFRIYIFETLVNSVIFTTKYEAFGFIFLKHYNI